MQAVTKQFLKNSQLSYQVNLKPVKDIIYEKYWIQENPSSRMITLWADTKDQMTFIILGKGGASLIENDITQKGFKEHKTLIQIIKPDDNATIDQYELTNLASYPEFNERLFLCSQRRKNINPAKDLLFNRDIPLAYKKYFEIVSGLVPIKKLGY